MIVLGAIAGDPLPVNKSVIWERCGHWEAPVDKGQRASRPKTREPKWLWRQTAEEAGKSSDEIDGEQYAIGVGAP